MEKSSSYYRRKELMDRMQLPLMSEVKEELGDKLANIVLLECPEALKEMMCLEPPLKGPGGTLWTSPSDLLIGKVCLKPPLTDKYIKALTHEGILEIGRLIEKKFLDYMEAERLLALREQADYLTKIANRERRIAVKHAREEEYNECERRMGLLSSELDAKLKLELEQLEKYMLEIQEEKIECALASAALTWQMKLDDAVKATTERLTAEFLKDLETQKQALVENFRKELENEQAQFDYAFKQQQEFCKETLKNLKHSLECKNFANLMYVLCMERRKCEIERAAIEQKFKLQVEGLEKTVSRQKRGKQKLLEQKNTNQKQIDAREKCLLAVIKQFQKFINFALKATPTQAEYLLSVEKLMLFELTQAMIKTKPKRTEIPVPTILPWKSQTSVTEKASGLIAKDYHECNNETEPALDAVEHDVMPAIYYDDNIYVREDFRNMFMNKIEISKSDPVWNKDVDNLIKILKNTVRIVDKDQQENEVEKEITSEENKSLGKQNGHKGSKVYYKSATSTFSERSRPLNVSKSALKKSPHKLSEEKPPIVYCTIPEEVLKSGDPNTSSVKQLIKELIDIEVTPIETTGILGATDSLIKVRKEYAGSTTFQIDNPVSVAETSRKCMEDEESHKNSLTGTVVSFENLDMIRIPDEILLSKGSNRPSKSSMKQWSTPYKPLKPDAATQIDSILLHRQSSSKSTESKLLTVKDSILIHRHSHMSNPPTTTNVSKQASKDSKICSHVNSLILIRRMTQHKDKSRQEISRPPSKQVTVDDAEIKKRVSPLTVSRMEIANIPAHYTDAVVNFSPLHEVYETQEIQLDTKDSPWKIYESQAPQNVVDEDNFLTKVNEAAIMGDSTVKGEQSEEFTINRINSILAMLREEPSLIKLFTSCTK